MSRFAILVVAGVLGAAGALYRPACVFSADAVDDDNAKKIVGVWEQVTAPERSFEFHKDGKYVTKRKNMLIVEGTFAIKGGDLHIMSKGITQTAHIKKLAQNEMRLEFKDAKLEFEYKRVK